ncbi:diguanylate cyclase (GGDEF) domain-containing protein [Geodermatophilus siccatus]|uniref:Iron-sulfur cluster carrier protein n=1 Tax=Geodermatophilus siccatus TaxID=1137991 RepID=A0A1G9PMK3_9ACTN|nr:diguanylate cyclase (GGDEF) domain-containing protein [Geodermatophilus siccatus]
MAVRLADVDRFEEVNDRHGHGGGDEALLLIAGAPTSRVRAGDVVARLGGDELAVLLPGTDLGRAVTRAEELRAAALALDLSGGGPGLADPVPGRRRRLGRDAVPERLTVGADARLHRAEATRNAVCAGPWTAAPSGLRSRSPSGRRPGRMTAVQWQQARERRSPPFLGGPDRVPRRRRQTHTMSAPLTGAPALDAVNAALATVQDPEINRPLPELGMVKDVQIAEDGTVRVEVYLTVAGCPMRETITSRVTQAVSAVPGVTSVQVGLDVMSDEQRAELRRTVRGTDAADPVIPFSQPGSLTRVYAVASGKGGVGKSSVTVNLAAALAKRGLSVGVVDADIYGHSVPRMLGVDDKPTQVDNMIMPPQAYGVKVISIGMFTPGNTPVVWRGPMLHRALQQFLADVWWGDLDVLLLDLPPGTGDVAISIAQLLPNAEILVVTTPQLAAAEVAERAGAIATQTHQQVVGVIENMSWLELPDGSRMEVFGSGGGEAVSDALTRTLGARVPLLGQIPLDTRVREAGDAGAPVVLADPDSPAAQALAKITDGLATRQRGLSGMSLGLTPVRH